MSQQQCIIPGCTQIGVNQFPNDTPLWLLWRKTIIKAAYPRIGTSWQPRTSDLLCHLHFKPEDYREGFVSKILKKTAVPSVFPPSICSEVKNNCGEKMEVNESDLGENSLVHVSRGSSRRVTIFQGENHSNNLCKALNDLRVRGLCCDISIRVPNVGLQNTEGILFKAHSVVLAARSRFFKTFFMKPENYTHQTVVLPSYINARAVEIVLHYMYTGKLGIRKDTVSTIYQVGWLFQMDDILMLCRQFCKMKKFTPSQIEVSGKQESSNDEQSTPLELPNENATTTLNANDDDDSGSIIAIDDDNNESPDTESADETKDVVEIPSEINKNQPEEEITPEIKLEEENKPETTEDEKDEKFNNNIVQLVEGPPEMIECTPTILDENDDDDDEDEDDYSDDESNNTKDKRERKLVIFKTGASTAEHVSVDGLVSLIQPSKENGNSDSIVVRFKSSLNYPSPVLYVLHGMKNYTDLLVQNGFCHIEFHVDSNCRKGVVKTDGSLMCVMFGQVNHFFPIFHSVTADDIERYKYEENKPLTFSTKKIVPIKRPLEITQEWDPIFGRDRDCEKDVLHCFTCSCVFFTIQGKASHLLRHHRDILHWDTELNVYRYKCGACDFMNTNLRLLYFHRHQKHDWQLPEVVLQFRCGLCCSCETSIHTARDHMVKVHNFSQLANPLPASSGKKVFLHLVTKDGLKRQLITAPPSEPMEITSDYQDGANRRMVKTDDKPFKCPHCEYASAYAGNLKCHIKNKHLGPSGSSPKKKRRRRRKNVY